MRRGWIVAMALLVGCGGTTIHVESGGDPVRVQVGGERNAVRLETQGEDVVVHFAGRVFMFRGLSAFEAEVESERVKIEAGAVLVELNASQLSIKRGDSYLVRGLERLPVGSRIVYHRDRISVER